MESKNKLKLLGLVAASLLVVACGSNEPKDQEQAGNTPASSTESSNAGASTTALGGETNITESTVEEAPIAAPSVFYFGFDKSALSQDTREGLDQLAIELKGTQGKVRIEGNTDERGTREYNLALGERRAQSVANYLAVQGVDPARFDIISYGEEKPAVYGSNEAAWAKNRRVEVVR
ncbi:Outer membrane protein P6 [BD1-7 clade bacterium]|uniref:Peptidoglycan-associated lipoprotein n=1 Tax=BD1-7 clade bacterium TaxID=2029982 RepID=A0A5S9MSM8_9GAMM|nr:Outer membrane protein P6 [BD1-7 clade bacterium]CAA0081534.1 Outer membrane protein P6 [BD1-7 clade bacterium]CAA0084980.1 Outer membrane protein P6 [BD1-7 clade bacterium]